MEENAPRPRGRWLRYLPGAVGIAAGFYLLGLFLVGWFVCSRTFATSTRTTRSDPGFHLLITCDIVRDCPVIDAVGTPSYCAGGDDYSIESLDYDSAATEERILAETEAFFRRLGLQQDPDYLHNWGDPRAPDRQIQLEISEDASTGQTLRSVSLMVWNP